MAPTSQGPTIVDVARRAGVSTATVSRVLNGSSPVIPQTAERVRSAIVELNYVPRSAARVLASRKTFAIGLLLPEISGAFFMPLLRGVEAGARQAGFHLLVHATGDPPETRIPRRPLGEHNVDGLLVFTDSLDSQELVHLHSVHFPVVLLHQSPPDHLSIPTITIENKSGAAKLMDHLIEVHKRRRIVFLQGLPSHEDSMWRERGYREALNAHGIPFHPSLVAQGGFNEQVAAAAMEDLVERGVEFDAVFCCDDDSASGALRALRELGKSVPEMISVAGFDDAPFAPYLSPPLTTVHAPTEQVGFESVRQLVAQIHGESVQNLVLLPTELVIRNSCGCHSPEERSVPH